MRRAIAIVEVASGRTVSRWGNLPSLARDPGAALADGRLLLRPRGGPSDPSPVRNGPISPPPSTTTAPFYPPRAFSRRHFSTAPLFQKELQEPARAGSNEKRRPKRRPKKKRDPIVVTPAAAARIQFLIDQHNRDGMNRAVGIRLGTKKRGCNGLSYTLNYAYTDHAEKHGRDEAMTIALPSPGMPGEGLEIFVEPMALMNVIGTTMDFIDDEMSSEFTFTNPNSKGECGCGESFNI